MINNGAAEIQHHSKWRQGAPNDRAPRQSKQQAAAYAGCESRSAFNDWVRRGFMPRPIPGTRKWDRKAIDAALDRLTGLQAYN